MGRPFGLVQVNLSKSGYLELIKSHCILKLIVKGRVQKKMGKSMVFCHTRGRGSVKVVKMPYCFFGVLKGSKMA